MNPALIRVARYIDATPQTLFDLVANPAMHPELDDATTVTGPLPGNPARLSLHARFGMTMRLPIVGGFAAKYQTHSEVVEFVAGERIAWRVGGGGAIWRYTFQAAETSQLDGASEKPRTKVTEEWDARDVRLRRVLVLAGMGKRALRGMSATLDRLADQIE